MKTEQQIIEELQKADDDWKIESELELIEECQKMIEELKELLGDETHPEK